MMKSLMRWSATLGLIGGTVLASCLSFPVKLLAIPAEQIVQKLNSVPVFTVADDKGDILLAAGDNNQRVVVSYLSRQDAQKMVDQLAQKNPSQKVQVLPMPLGAMYQILQENNKKESKAVVDFIPTEVQVKSAIAILSQKDPKVKDFPGVPLFFATFKKDQKEIPLQAQIGQKTVVPFFFDKEMLQQEVEKFKKAQPDVAATVQIQVAPLEGLISAFETKKDDFLNYIVLIPSQDSADFVQKLQQQQRANTNQPATAPANTSQPAPKK